MKNVIVVGASSGIGRALALDLARRGWRVGVAARRTDLLAELEAAHPNVVSARTVDVTAPDAPAALEALALAMGGANAFVLSSGVGEANRALLLETELDTLAVNVTGFVAAANAALHHLEARGGGTLVGLSSVAGVRPSGGAVMYAASKNFVSNYMGGLRMRARRKRSGVKVLDVRPGFVRTDMMKAPSPFWVSEPERAARQIADAMEAGRNGTLYVTKRWRLVAWALRLVPERFLPT